MDGFTGFNPTKLMSEIMTFYNEGVEQATSLKEKLDNFANDINNNWASPRAVEFAPVLGNLYGAIESLRLEYSILSHDLIEAYNSHAIENNMPRQDNYFSNNKNVLENEYDNYYSLREQDGQGRVGMRTNTVFQLLQQFIAEFNSILTKDMSFPPSLYDPTGEQIQTFKTRLSNEISNINTKLNAIIMKISTAINEEKDRMIAATTEAQQQLGL